MGIARDVRTAIIVELHQSHKEKNVIRNRDAGNVTRFERTIPSPATRINRRTNGAVPVAQGEPAWRRTLGVDCFFFPCSVPSGRFIVPNRTVGAEDKT